MGQGVIVKAVDYLITDKISSHRDQAEGTGVKWNKEEETFSY